VVHFAVHFVVQFVVHFVIHFVMQLIIRFLEHCVVHFHVHCHVLLALLSCAQYLPSLHPIYCHLRNVHALSYTDMRSLRVRLITLFLHRHS
jgi:hypothetical protein